MVKTGENKSIRTYKKIITTFILSFTISIFTVLNTIPIFAASTSTVLPGFAEINHPDSIKLKSKGCQEIKFEYIIDEDLQTKDSVYVIQLVHKSKKIVYGGVAWFSELTYTGDKFPSMSRIGVLPMKICRNNWVFKANTGSTKYSAVKPGSYDFYFGYGYLAEDGSVLGEKNIIRKSITLFN